MKNKSERFFMLPAALFEAKYSGLSDSAKLLYALLLNRRSLSEKNGLTDKNGVAVVYCSNSEVCRRLGCGHDKATVSLRQLEGAGLIRRKKQGRCKPDIIYVENAEPCEKAAVMNAEKPQPAVRKNRSPECEKPACNYTDINYKDISYTEPSIGYAETEERIKDQIEFDVLSERDYGDVLGELVNLITDTYCTEEKAVRIGRRMISAETVRCRLSKLTAEHIEAVIAQLSRNTSRIRNMRAYLLTLIYGAIDCTEADGLYGN